MEKKEQNYIGFIYYRQSDMQAVLTLHSIMLTEICAQQHCDLNLQSNYYHRTMQRKDMIFGNAQVQVNMVLYKVRTAGCDKSYIINHKTTTTKTKKGTTNKPTNKIKNGIIKNPRSKIRQKKKKENGSQVEFQPCQ